jgi:hypothetical protein
MKNTFIGQPMERREDLRFLRGRGEYVDDVAMPGLLHAAILRSSVAHGTIKSIDASAALKRPGVRTVITAADMPGGPPIVPMRLQPLPEFKPFEQPAIAHDKVRYVGEPVAVVLADTVALAEDALDGDRGRDRGTAGGRRMDGRAAQREPPVRQDGHQPLDGVRGAQGRRRRSLRQGALRAQGAACAPAATTGSPWSRAA